MILKDQSPTTGPLEDHDVPDLDAIEDAVRRLEVLPYALWSPETRAEFDALVDEAARMLLELHDRGWIEFVRHQDGTITAELLERVRH
jgi:hypothetical protein